MTGACASEKNHTCESCKFKDGGFFCHLSPAASEEFEAIRYTTAYPAGAVLCLEREDSRGIFILCSGQVKLSVSSLGGKTLIMRIARPGDIIGLTATMSGIPYEATAETLHPCQVTFIRRNDFLRFLKTYPEAYQAITTQLSSQYSRACEQLRTIGLSTSANEKLARLFLGWSSDGRETRDGTQITMPLTHEQIAECVGSTRETVTRTLSEFKSRHLVTLKGATMLIPNLAALAAVGGA